MKNLIEKMKALRIYAVRCSAWAKKIDNAIFLFNCTLLSIPLLLIGMCTVQTAIITFGIWCFGISISLIFWRISTIDDSTRICK